MTVVERPGAPEFPTIAGSIPASSRATMDEAINVLQAHKDAWTAISAHVRVAIIDDLIKSFHALVPRWVAACLQAKGIAEDSPTASEEWATGPWVILKHLRQLRQALVDIEAKGHPTIPGPVKTRPDGQVIAQVFPQTIYDRTFFTGITAEIWMQPGVTKDRLTETQAVVYRQKQSGKVALVLGAGNVSSIGPLDILYKLFVEDQVVVFKTNPVNAYLGPLLEEAFSSIIKQGFLRVVYGGATEGAYLCNHAGIDEIHITGSDKTFDAIVFGTGVEGAARKAERHPQLNKRITGELGNVSPVIVVPGPWKADDLAYHGDHIASMLTNNAGFNCNATRVIIQQTGWERREQLLQEIRQVLAKVPPRAAYYPGARDRQQSFVEVHQDAEQIGNAANGQLPWTLITNVDATKEDDIAFTTEAFCSLFAETTLEAASVAEYIDRAVAFCNDKLWGTLNATIIIHPQSLKDPVVAAAFERAITNLRYGTVGINYWAGVGYTLGTTTWGAFPGHELNTIQSGTGVVHNALMFEHPQKTVLRAPFRIFPTPVLFVTQGKTARQVFAKLVDFEANPSAARVPGILWSALFD